MTQKLHQAFQPSDRGAAEALRERLRTVFEDLVPDAARRQADLQAGRRAIVAGDLALAALASSMVQPREKCGGHFHEMYSTLLAHAEVLQEVDMWRATPLGKFSLWMYEQHRVQDGARSAERTAGKE